MSTATHSEIILPSWTTGDRLVKAREHVGMTQDDMANAIGVGLRTISRHEAAANPKRTTVIAYAQVTGVPLWWLEGRERDDEDPEGEQAMHASRWTDACGVAA